MRKFYTIFFLFFISTTITKQPLNVRAITINIIKIKNTGNIANTKNHDTSTASSQKNELQTY